MGQGDPWTAWTGWTVNGVHIVHTVPVYPELAANAALVLIGVATALLDRQLASQAAAFEKEGGFTERLYRVRSAAKKGKP